MGACEKTLCFYVINLLLTISSLHRQTAAAGDDDAAVMSKLAKSISPTPAGWIGSEHCQWSGVTCDSSGRVTAIDISSRSLSGELPSDLNHLSNLKNLYVQRNSLSGAIPPLSNLANLQKINFDNNNFTSVPPDFVTGVKSLQQFSISENPNIAPWTIPEKLTESSPLVTISASRCGLTGTIPDMFGSFPNLQNVKLSYNNLTGPLPPSLAKSGITHLLINNQLDGLTGFLDVLGTMSQLRQLWLQSNKFTGPIPDLSLCSSLSDLQLRDNMLTGVIPPSLFSLPKLTNLSLQNNIFQGPFPTFEDNAQVTLGDSNNFCNPTPGPCDFQVTTLLEVAGALRFPVTLAENWKGNNPCNGWSFITCDAKGRVTVINFSNRTWEGVISPAIANLTSLKTLLFNDNKLIGSIPSSLTHLQHLQLLDVSNNNLSGEVPDFDPRVTLKTSGNTFLGKDLPSDGTSIGNWYGNAISRKPPKPWLIVTLVLVSLVLIGVFTLIIYKQKGRIMNKKYKKDDERDMGVGLNGYVGLASECTSQYSGGDTSDIQLYEGGNISIPIEILLEVTNNFDEENVLGKGGFGVVYKGTLHDGTKIAVKRMEASVMTTKGLNEFKAEIEVLSKVRHRHLVALHGFCVNGNERLLVYEYMPKGTLAQYLLQCDDTEGRILTWKERLGIALDVAKGVEYLHTLAQQSFIHRDLKPSNILLGEGMRAKVSDFGLVKSTAPDGKCSVETRLAGTFGYLAPEYAATGRVTTKVDVFAYGVVLMEIITGRKALDDSLPEEKSHLVTWFRKVIVKGEGDDLRRHIDPSLDPDEETFDSISKVAELAGHCTSREPSNRPDMSHMVNVLSPLVQQWKPNRSDDEDCFGIDFHMSLPQALQRWKNGATKDLYSMNSFGSISTPKRTTSDIQGSFS